MERKLSAKATQIRHRLTFTRSSSARALESTLVSPIEVSPSNSRPRSATSPESPTHNEPTWHNRDPGPIGGYSFTDEPGYFRPASPFIDRQEIEEDLEADIKYACAMLSHSIDRGMPAGLSYRSAVTVGQDPAQPSVAAPSSLKQHVVLLSAINLQESKRHDSGVDIGFNSPSQIRRPSGNSVSGTNTSARFYNKQPSVSPPHSPSPGTRSPSQSLAITVEDKERGRACSPSSIPFSYSPPQLHNEWTWASKPITLHSPVSSLNETDKIFEATESELKTRPHEIATNTNANPETFSPAISPHEAPLGWTGRTWLHVSGDIPCLIDEENAPAIEAKQTKPMTRFYSSCNRTTGSLRSREWPPKDVWEDWDQSAHGKVTPDSLLGLSRPGTGISRLSSASTNEGDLPGGYLHPPFADPNRGMSYSSSCLADGCKHQERVYSVAMPSLPKNNRRTKASLLLRKLAGLGMKKKDNDNENGVY